ncbi:sensor histidine kinase [Cnuibacter sp. UC19_7]|uniref:sensor histidine kinase n=1 Tax=Cnuibacter sp. UC19_7 TaxID=3350166 RepID=UPI00366D54E3
MSTERGRGRSPLTLRARITIGVTVVVAAVLAVIGAGYVATLSSSVTTVVDSQLTGSAAALEHSVDKFGPGSRGGSGYSKPMTGYVGLGPGTIIAYLDDGAVVESASFSDADATALDAAAAAAVQDAAAQGDGRRAVDVPGLGDYRIDVHTRPDGSTLVAGVSLSVAQAAIMQQTIVMVLLGVLALLVTVVGVLIVVRLALRPLDRVAQTASTVAALPLATEDVSIAQRVDPADTDARTEVGQVGAALNLLIDNVDRAFVVRGETDRRMRRFVTDASHELRTPLAAIRGYAELTRQESGDLPELTEYSLQRIEAEASRMGSLVDDLLLLARLDEGQDLRIDDVDLAEVVANAVSDARAASPDHDWVADVPEEPMLVRGDHERLHQVVANLLSNAIVHTPAGTTVTTTVETVVGGERVRLIVADDGPGFPPELVPELFERFVRADGSRSRRTGSTGLGLAIVRSIVEAHGGSVAADTTAAGARLVVELPASSDTLPRHAPGGHENSTGSAIPLSA